MITSPLPRRRVRTSRAVLFACAGLALSSLPAAAQTWSNDQSGGTLPWATGTNWIGSVAPVGSVDTTVAFNYSFSSSAQTAQNNIGTSSFDLNVLSINDESPGGFTISAASSANALAFNTSSGSVAPSISNLSATAATLSAPLALNAATNVTGSASGNLTISGIVGGSAGFNVNTSGAGVVILSGANTFTGNSTLSSGNLSLGGASALGASSNSLSVNGGTLRFNSPATVAQSVSLNADLNITGTNGGTFGGAISGSGGVILQPTANTNFTFQGNNTFGGGLIVQRVGNNSVLVTLSGTSGAFSNVSSINLGGNSTLSLNNTASNNNNRLNDVAPIKLDRATFTLTGNSLGTSESIGAVTFSGRTEVVVTPNAASNATLVAASFQRSSRGTLVITGTNLGTAGGANTSNIRSTIPLAGDLVGGGGAAGSNNISILPYAFAVHNTGTVSGQLVTYDNATGFRPLSNSEYATSLNALAGSTSATNVKVSGAPTLKGSTTVNALVIDSPTGAGTGGSVYMSPGASITPTSGAILFSNSNVGTFSVVPSIIGGGNVNFASSEGIIHSHNLSAITSAINGTNGLTTGGLGNLILAGHNTYTGPTTINGGVVDIDSDAALGNPSNGVTLASGNSLTTLDPNQGGLQFASTALFGQSNPSSLTVGRNITLAGAGGAVSAFSQTSRLTLSGVISGPGMLQIGIFSSSGVVKLTNSNTYTGPTLIQGALAVDSDAALGAGGSIIMDRDGALINDSPFASSRDVLLVAGSPKLYTNGADMTLSGRISNQANVTLVKGGANKLTLTGDSPFSGTVQVGTQFPIADQNELLGGGTVVLSGNGALNSVASMNVFSRSTLVLDNTATNRSDRINANVTLAGGALEFRGNGVAPSTEHIGALIANQNTVGNPPVSNGAGVLTIVPGAGQSTVLTASNFTRTSTAAMLVRGANLGGAIGPNTANLVLNTVSLTNNIIPGMVGDTSVTGGGTGFVTRSSGTGVRLLNAGEYTTNAFGAAINSDLTNNNVLAGPTSANAIRISAGGGIDATGQTLTVGTGMILANGGANLGITGGTVDAGATPFTIWNNSDLTISSQLAGSGGMNKAGVGNLRLNTATSLSGVVTISNGTLTYGVPNAIPSGDAIVLGSMGNELGALDLNGMSSTVSSIGGVGNIYLGGADLTINGASATFAGSIRGSGNVIYSNLTTLSGISSYTGTTTVAGGTVSISTNQPSVGNGPLGAGNGSGGGDLILGAGPSTVGTINFRSGNVAFFDKNITVASTPGAESSGIFSAIEGNTVQFGADIVLNSTLRLTGVAAASTSPFFTGASTLSGRISGTGGLDWFGANYNITGDNTFTGNVTLEAGSSQVLASFGVPPNYLGVGSDAALGRGNLVVKVTGNKPLYAGLRADLGPRHLVNDLYFANAASGTLAIAGVNDLTMAGRVDLGGGDLAAASPPSIAGPRTLQVFNAGSTTLSGTISGASTSTLTKTGGGKLVLSGNNTYTGTTTVATGALIMNGSNNGAGTVTVNGNALLGGHGSIAGPVDVLPLGILSPGESAGALTTGNTHLADGALLSWELGDPTLASASDRVSVIGNLNIADGTGQVSLRIDPLTGFQSMATYTLFDYSGTLTGGPANFQITSLPGSVTSAFIDTTSQPGSVLLVVVPEPGTVGGIVAATVVLTTARKRRHR